MRAPAAGVGGFGGRGGYPVGSSLDGVFRLAVGVVVLLVALFMMREVAVTTRKYIRRKRVRLK